MDIVPTITCLQSVNHFLIVTQDSEMNEASEEEEYTSSEEEVMSKVEINKMKR